MYDTNCSMPPMCSLASSPCLSVWLPLLCVESVNSVGAISRAVMFLDGKRAQNYFQVCQTPSTTQPSTITCAGAGCVCCHAHPQEQVVLQPLSANSASLRYFHHFPWLSEPSLTQYKDVSVILRTVSANIRDLGQFLKCCVQCMGVVVARSWTRGAHLQRSAWKVRLVSDVRSMGVIQQWQSWLLVKWRGNAVYGCNRSRFGDCCSAAGLDSEGRKDLKLSTNSGLYRRRQTRPRHGPRSAFCTQTATAAKGVKTKKRRRSREGHGLPVGEAQAKVAGVVLRDHLVHRRQTWHSLGHGVFHSALRSDISELQWGQETVLAPKYPAPLLEWHRLA